MCGIGGIVRFDDRPLDRERALAMMAHLRHRGPDGDGVREHERCVFVHTRLSIIDLLGGVQPMHVPRRDAFGEVTLIFNGEIYNHRDLRAKLERLGHQFTSDHCDTEVLLHGYRAWGTELPKHLHGMFAFAIWDNDRKQLFLCRDRAGKKPLYFRRTTGELAFASLVSTLVATDKDRAVDIGAMVTFLRLGYTFGRSLVRGVEEVPAAHWVLFDADGSVQSQRYWRPPPISRTSTSLGAVKATREVLEEAVYKRLEADVPLGCFLSGGIDSSVVAAIAQRGLRARRTETLRTFSVAMPDLDYDESPYARAVARHIGSQHTELVADARHDIVADLRRMVSVWGEPTGDSSVLPTYWLSRTTRQHVKTVLSGDGGDELFGGYDRYRAMRLLEQHRWWIRAIPSAVVSDSGPRSARHRLGRLMRAGEAEQPAEQYRRMIYLFSDEQITSLGLADRATLAAAEPPLTGWPDEPDPAHAAMRWDLEHYLPFDLLRKIDRASMAVSLEVRCPMLDTQVCDLAGHLPTSVLMPRGKQKGLLRQIAAELLPVSIVRRPKRGFALPIGHWFRTSFRLTLQEHLLGGGLDGLSVDRTEVERMLREHVQDTTDHTHRLFALLDLALWRQWLDQPTAPPTEFT